MSQHTSSGAPRWFFVVGVIAFLWNLLGVAAYVMQVTMSPESLAALPEAERLLYENTPAWAVAGFATAVNFGALGCLFLLLRKTLAVPLLVISLTGLLVQMFHAFFISNSIEVFGPGGMIMPAMVLVVAIYLVWLAVSAKNRGWIS